MERRFIILIFVTRNLTMRRGRSAYLKFNGWDLESRSPVWFFLGFFRTNLKCLSMTESRYEYQIKFVNFQKLKRSFWISNHICQFFKTQKLVLNIKADFSILQSSKARFEHQFIKFPEIQIFEFSKARNLVLNSKSYSSNFKSIKNHFEIKSGFFYSFDLKWKFVHLIN